MEARGKATASTGLILGVCALACALLVPATLVIALSTGHAFQFPFAPLGLLNFFPSIPIGLIAWRLGSRELKLHLASGMPGDPPRQACLARALGMTAVVLSVGLVLFAALTFTGKFSN
jgi:hypothetical protein